MKNEEEKRALFLPVKLYDRIEERAKFAGFDSIDEYIQFLLEEVAWEKGEKEGRTFSNQEEEVKKRLRALGYLG